MAEVFLRDDEECVREEGDQFYGTFDQVMSYVRRKRPLIKLADIRMISER